MWELINTGVAEPVFEGYERPNQIIYYMPHRPVYRDDSLTTKLRIVFDASAHGEGALSLNDVLRTGSNLLPEVFKLLLNFRIGKYGLIADIKQAFLQIVLAEEERDSHRFIWYSQKLSDINDLPQYKTFRMTRVTFGVKCSPFLLTATLRVHLKDEIGDYPFTSKLLSDSFYMDDLVLSFDDKEEGRNIYHEAMEILERASMPLRKWNTNCRYIRSEFEAKDSPQMQKVLGLKWFISSDELVLNTENLEDHITLVAEKKTKRSVLQIISRIYDPLGMIYPVSVKLKMLFQEIWKRKLNWDEPLPIDLVQTYNNCTQDLLAVKEMAIPRCAILQSSSKKQIHIFVDASIKAYGAVAFIRSEDNLKDVRLSFLCAKNRIAPLKENNTENLTLPRLELTAALVGARLLSYLKKNLKVDVDKYFLWCDSKIALFWIKGDADKWKPYVRNRVEEIRKYTDVLDWNHCSGKENPADLLTRGISGKALLESKLWKHGPEWLRNFSQYSSERNELFEIPVNLSTLAMLTNTCERRSEITDPLLS